MSSPRTGPSIQKIITPVLTNQWGKVITFATRMNGGWEAWLQVEIASAWLDAIGNNNFLNFARESYYYPSTGEKADFKYWTTNSQGVSTPAVWQELKVDNASATTMQTLKNFANDVFKVSGQKGNRPAQVPTGGLVPIDTVAAIAVLVGQKLPRDAKTNNATRDTLATILAQTLSSKAPKSGWAAGSIWTAIKGYVGDGKSWLPLDKYDGPLENAMVVLYYVE